MKSSLSKQLIENIAGKKAPGPSTTFSVFHIFYALELTLNGPIGRSRLASKLEVGEGAIRTILRRLKEAGLIAVSKEGCKITANGLNVWTELQSVFPKRVELNNLELIHSEFTFAFLVKESADKIGSGIEQRDAAVIAGAEKATIVVAKGDNLIIDSVSNDIEKDFPDAASQIKKCLIPEDNDVIIIAGAESLMKARKGAFSAGWSLLNRNRKN